MKMIRRGRYTTLSKTLPLIKRELTNMELFLKEQGVCAPHETHQPLGLVPERLNPQNVWLCKSMGITPKELRYFSLMDCMQTQSTWDPVQEQQFERTLTNTKESHFLILKCLKHRQRSVRTLSRDGGTGGHHFCILLLPCQHQWVYITPFCCLKKAGRQGLTLCSLAEMLRLASMPCPTFSSCIAKTTGYMQSTQECPLITWFQLAFLALWDYKIEKTFLSRLLVSEHCPESSLKHTPGISVKEVCLLVLRLYSEGWTSCLPHIQRFQRCFQGIMARNAIFALYLGLFGAHSYFTERSLYTYPEP